MSPDDPDVAGGDAAAEGASQTRGTKRARAEDFL